MNSTATTPTNSRENIHIDAFARDLESLHILPVVYRENDRQRCRKMTDANALGMLAFASGVFLSSCYGVHTRGINTPNVILGISIFFSGVCQFISGFASIALGDRFGATVFTSYGAFNLAYAFIYLPSSGILDAYTIPAPLTTNGVATTPILRDEFNQALALWLWTWFILSAIFLMGSIRRDWVCVTSFSVLCTDLACQAFGLMFGVQKLVVAGNALGFVVAFLAYYTGASMFWGGDATPFRLSTFPIRRSVRRTLIYGDDETTRTIVQPKNTT